MAYLHLSESEPESDASKCVLFFGRNSLLFTFWVDSHIPLESQILSAAPLIFLTYFNVTHEQYHKNAFNPFLNGK